MLSSDWSADVCSSDLKRDYAGVQAGIDAGDADPMFAVLREIGELLIRREQRRGGISLPLPEQEVRVEDGRWALEFRARHPVEDWNEQISLLTGMAAAHLMVQHRVGLLRTQIGRASCRERVCQYV